MPYAVAVRYPDDFFMPTMREAKKAREAARIVHAWLKQAAPEL